jgi:peptidoglycan/LPS O-acetylase OafA/YrhL
MSLFPGIKSELNKHAGSPRPGRYEWLQCFRGFAALLVVGYHFYPQLERYDLSPYFAPVLHWASGAWTYSLC